MRLSDQQEETHLRELNRVIRSEAFQPKALPHALRIAGYDLANCIVLDCLPDSGETWLVKLMTWDKDLVEIDLDLSNSEETRVSRISRDSYKKSKDQFTLQIAEQLLKEIAGGA